MLEQVEGIAAVHNETDSEVLIKKVLSTDPEMWFNLARWAKEHGYFESWERKLALGLGIFIKKGRISHKQAKQALRLLEQAQQLGFKPLDK